MAGQVDTFTRGVIDAFTKGTELRLQREQNEQRNKQAEAQAKAAEARLKAQQAQHEADLKIRTEQFNAAQALRQAQFDQAKTEAEQAGIHRFQQDMISGVVPISRVDEQGNRYATHPKYGERMVPSAKQLGINAGQQEAAKLETTTPALVNQQQQIITGTAKPKADAAALAATTTATQMAPIKQQEREADTREALLKMDHQLLNQKELEAIRNGNQAERDKVRDARSLQRQLTVMNARETLLNARNKKEHGDAIGAMADAVFSGQITKEEAERTLSKSDDKIALFQAVTGKKGQYISNARSKEIDAIAQTRPIAENIRKMESMINTPGGFQNVKIAMLDKEFSKLYDETVSLITSLPRATGEATGQFSDKDKKDLMRAVPGSSLYKAYRGISGAEIANKTLSQKWKTITRGMSDEQKMAILNSRNVDPFLEYGEVK